MNIFMLFFRNLIFIANFSAKKYQVLFKIIFEQKWSSLLYSNIFNMYNQYMYSYSCHPEIPKVSNILF